jgi:hypothetical protein
MAWTEGEILPDNEERSKDSEHEPSAQAELQTGFGCPPFGALGVDYEATIHGSEHTHDG